MQKKTLVLAIAGALTVSTAFAAESDGNVIELYGKAYPELLRPHGKGATESTATVSTLGAKPTGTGNIIERTEMQSSNSRFGVRGQENLGGGLKAIFQLETEFHVDSNDSTFAQRDSFVGLSHKGWGDIKLGRMDTPFKKFGDEISFLGISSGNFVSTSNVLRKTGFGTSSSSSFHLRRQNAVMYESPHIAGFDGAVQYSTDETDTVSRHPHVWSEAIRWKGGPLVVALAHEQHWDLFGGSRNAPSSMSNFSDQSAHSKDQATQATVVYEPIKGHRIEFDYNWKEYKENASVTGRFQQYKNTAYEIAWDARWSRAWRTMIEYVKANKGSCSRVNAACTTDGLDGSQFQLGVAYYFSRRTYLFAMGAFLRNGFSARYNNQDLQAPAVGEDIDTWAVGLSHSF